MTYRIALADDESLVRECVRRILAEEHDLEVVAETADGASLLDYLRNAPVRPDLVIADLSMPPPDGIQLTRQITNLYPEVKVLILTMHKEEEYLAPAMSAGAAGYLLKDDAASELIPAIRLIRAGCVYISSQFRPHFNFLERSGSTGSTPPAKEGPEAEKKHRNAHNGGG